MLGVIDDQKLAHKKKLMQALQKYLPQIAVEYCSELLMLYKLHLHIEVARKDRLGDYSPHLGKGNRISINHNLNPYDFLITFIHELAHHVTHQKHGPNHQSHGAEWKQAFKDCMRPTVMLGFFPPDIAAPLIKHMQKPKYTHSGDIALMKALSKYNVHTKTDQVLVSDLPEGTVFWFQQKQFRKLQKLRTYVLCEALTSGKRYKIHGLCAVNLVSKT